MHSNVARRWALTTTRPILLSILPKKKTMNRLLYDNDSRLVYKKVMTVLNSVYEHVDNPEQIQLPKFASHDDLMVLRSILYDIRNMTHSFNKNLVDLENELVEQAAEMGNKDAIAMLAFEAIQKKDTPKEDYDYANKLIIQLSDTKHPLVFKLAGDLASSKGLYAQAAEYWNRFLELEDNTILASHVYANLGAYYYQDAAPRPDLNNAKVCFEKAITFGELDNHIVKAHYFLGQLYTLTDPELSRYHLQVSASRGLQESFPTLGFMELNVFNNISKALEWFKLGVESSNDLSCLVGQFDAHILLDNIPNALAILRNLDGIMEKLDRVIHTRLPNLPALYRDLAVNNLVLLDKFFTTRKDVITNLRSLQ